jgi:hypothetical protein
MQSKLQTFTQSLEGGTLDRKKSLKGAEKEFELLIEKAKELREELVACES